MANPEDLLLSALLRTGDMTTIQRHNLGSFYFDLRRVEMEWIEHFYVQHNKMPSKMVFKHKFPDFSFYKTDDTDHWCGEVKQDYARRSMAELMDRTIDLMTEGKISPAIDGLGTELLQIQAAIAEAPDDYDVSVDAEAAYKNVTDRISRVVHDGRAGIPTGFPSLDDVTGGSQPGWYGIVAARLGKGKTWTLLRMAIEAAMYGRTVLYYTLEQSRVQITLRAHTMLAARMGVDNKGFRAMALTMGEGIDLLAYRKFIDSLDDSIPGRLIINDARRGRVSPMSVAAGIERTECDMVIVDYITLMQMQGDGGYQSVLALSADLQQLTQRYEISTWVGSQVNRATGKDLPEAGNLSRADIGIDADLVLTLGDRSQSVKRMMLAKNRHGPDGFSWLCRFKPNDGDFEEIDSTEADTLIAADAEVD